MLAASAAAQHAASANVTIIHSEKSGSLIMPIHSAAPPNCANRAGETRPTRSEDRFGVFDKILNVIRLSWPRKTAAQVAYITEMEERTVQFWLAGQTRMSVDAVISLLRTEQGYEILEAIMGDCPAKWWGSMKMANDIRKSRIALKAVEKRHAHLKAQLSLLDDQ